MKIKTIISLSFLTFLLIACSENEVEKSALEKIQDNKMDLPNLHEDYYEGISYELSNLFQRMYNRSNFTVSSNAAVRVIEELPLFFTVEKFTEEEAIEIEEDFEGDVNLLDAVHDMYTAKRTVTLENYKMTVKKNVPETVKFPGYTQVISGAPLGGEIANSYFMATLKIGDDYFVFQLIGKKENMGYLHDDFMDLISSVKD